MKIKAMILTALLALSMLCACEGTGSNAATDTEAANAITSTETGNSGNFSETIIIENPSTDTVIVEMP